MKRRIIITVIFLLSTLHFFAQKTKSDSTQAKAFFDKATILEMISNNDSAIAYYHKASILYKKTKQ